MEKAYSKAAHFTQAALSIKPGDEKGINNLIPYTEELTGYPTVAIGGIDQSTAAQVWECGVSSLAVIRAITLAEDPKQVIECFEVLMADSKLHETMSATRIKSATCVSWNAIWVLVDDSLDHNGIRL